MTNNQLPETIAIEHMKLFLTNIVPLDELPNKHFREIVAMYREGNLTMIEVLEDFKHYQKELGTMVRINKFLNNMIRVD